MMMRSLLIVSIVFYAAIGVAPANGETDCATLADRFAAPASEVAAIIADWLDARGYTVRREAPRPGTVHLIARRQSVRLEITVRPQSALAAVVSIHDNGAAPPGTCSRLKRHVDSELSTGKSQVSPPAVRHAPQTAPTAVLDQFGAVVCIHARSAGQEVQFSGFVVDPAGLVLCTAHDLTDHQKVMVTFYDGTHVGGNIVRLDRIRDLALVVCERGSTEYVSLTSARNLLGMGESVFSIGCPNSLGGTLAAGTVSGPPRRVGDQPLWQVEMAIYPGSSGSPVFDEQGRLVAMVKGRYRGTSTVGFLTPLETIIAFLLEDVEQ